MLDLKVIAIDSAKAIKGTWVKWMGAEFLIARYSNRFAETARAQLHLEMLPKLQEEGDHTDLDIEFRRRNAEIMAQYVLLGWKNIGVDGQEIPYSTEKATELLLNDDYQDLLDFIIREATSRENFMKANEDKAAKEIKNS